MGFHEIESDTYRLGRSSVLGNDYAGVHIDADADSGVAAVTLMRLRGGELPQSWWERKTPRETLGLREVAQLRAPALLEVASGLPRIRGEADRTPHLWFWAVVLQSVASPWLAGDESWFEQVEQDLRGTAG
jgi:hypothetical protein